ncbi:MAG: hypothetical protein K9M57_11570, partial [Phycisphaerae bacterium]|nr:hypothetical protein [Phycisphaerae bacterium]
ARKSLQMNTLSYVWSIKMVSDKYILLVHHNGFIKSQYLQGKTAPRRQVQRSKIGMMLVSTIILLQQTDTVF